MVESGIQSTTITNGKMTKSSSSAASAALSSTDSKTSSSNASTRNYPAASSSANSSASSRSSSSPPKDEVKQAGGLLRSMWSGVETGVVYLWVLIQTLFLIAGLCVLHFSTFSVMMCYLIHGFIKRRREFLPHEKPQLVG